jgi:hypothetical protein
MELDQQWLSEAVLINESTQEAVAGDVSLYRSIGEACRALEHWWVEERLGYAFTASGDRLLLTVDRSKNVVLEGREPCSDGKAIVLGWLKSSAGSVLQARKAKAAGGKVILSSFEERGLLPLTTEGLIAYVGFSR